MRSIEKKLQHKELESQEQVLAHMASSPGPGAWGWRSSCVRWDAVAWSGRTLGPAARGQPRVCHPQPAGGGPAPAPLPHPLVSVSCAGFILNQLEGGHSSQHPEQTWRHPEAEGTAHVWGSCSEQWGRLSWEQPPPHRPQQDHPFHLTGQNRSHAQLRPSNPW